MGSPGLYVKLAALALLQTVLVSARQHLVGDTTVWDSIFDSRFAAEVVTVPGNAWPEGPQQWQDTIIFSDTIKNRIFRYHRHRGITVLQHGSGGASAADLEWMAEPGSNGIVIDPHRDNIAYICQHGAHAVSELNLQSGEIKTLASHFRGMRLNGPNDITIDQAGGYLYFTDPVYAYLDKERFYDAEYLDKSCGENLGFKGLYRLRIDGGEDSLELLDAHRIQRPNGIAFSPDYSHLYVSECCQGSHLSNCTQGTSRYFVYSVLDDGRVDYKHVVEFHDETHSGTAGCADGFKVHPATGLIVGSCPMGVCIVRPGVTGTEAPSSSLLPPAPRKAQQEDMEHAPPKAVDRHEKLVLPGDGDKLPIDFPAGGDILPGDQSTAEKQPDLELQIDPQPPPATVEPQGEASEEGRADHAEVDPTPSGAQDEQLDSGQGDRAPAASVPPRAMAKSNSQSRAASESTVRLDVDATHTSGTHSGDGLGRKKSGMRIKVLPATDEAPASKATSFEVLEGNPDGTYASRRLLAFRSTSEHQEPLYSHAGLVAKLYLAHKTSNILFASDGYMYLTGEAPNGGGGALLRIPLRNNDNEAQTYDLHDELRHR